ncbi:minor tail protein [Desulfofustis phage LS06-2018-MD02]|jgi:hypothetical protein|nr:minor tail protein [Desulfofustis phage LS06-2018-MD02]
MAEAIIGTFWIAWAVFLAVQAFRQKPRIGYLLSSLLSGYTGYLLLT